MLDKQTEIKTEMSERFVVRLRGLPWSATDGEIADFLSVNIVGGENGIKSILTAEGRPSGEAYVELFSADDMQSAMDKDHEKIGKRYIEVFSSSVKEMEYVLDRSGQASNGNATSGGDTIVRLRGLPWQSTKDDVQNFFQGLDIVPNGILLPLDVNGRASGESFVEFSSPDDASQALGKHKEKIGHRYIEIFKSSRREVNEAAFGGGGRKRPGPYDRPQRGGRGGRMGGGGYGRSGGYGGGNGGGYGGGYDDYSSGGGGGYGDYYEDEYGDDGYGGDSYGAGGGYNEGGYDDYGGDEWYGQDDGYGNGGGYDDYGEEESSGYTVHMRGLPFKATDNDIKEFFSPLVASRVIREFGDDGRISGEANVEFASYQDAQAAMQKNKQSMQHRYIELFYRGQGGGGAGEGGGRGGGMRGRSGGMGGPKPLMGGRRGAMRGGRGGPMRRGRGRGGFGGW